MVLIDRQAGVDQFVVERFDYSDVNRDWAVLRLLTTLGGVSAPPSAAHLVVEPESEGDLFYAAARDGGVERRLLPGSGPGSELLWHATFALPLEIVEAPQAMFRLLAGRDMALALPVPARCELVPRALALAEYRQRRQLTFPGPLLGNARQLAALATTVAVTATSAPAVALAAAGGSSSPAGASVSTTAGTTSTTVAVSTHHAGKTVSVSTRHAGKAPAAASTTTSTTTATTPAATGTPARTTSSVSNNRLISASPKTAPASTHAAPKLPVVHLFSSSSHPAHRRAAAATVSPGATCTTAERASVVAYAAAPASHSVKVKCPTTPAATSASTPAVPPQGATLTIGSGTASAGGSGTASAGGSGTASTGGTKARGGSTSGGSTHTSGGKAPAHHGQPAHHRPTRSHVTGGASLLPPATGPITTSGSSSSTGSVPTLSGTPGYSGPSSWTGTVTSDPALTGAVTDLAGLLSNGDRPPSFLIPIYMEAGKRYNVPWEVLAGINAIESDFGRNLNTSSAGAVGWMQFEPSTWKQYGLAVDGHSVPNPYDPRDAIFSAARYLAAAGAGKDVRQAVFAYNHASWYVDEVMSRAQAIASHVQYERATVKHGTASVYFAGRAKTNTVVRYQGGVLSHYDRLISAANMVSAANFQYVYGGGHEQPAAFGPFDCSGSVSYVMQQAGYNVPTTVSGEIPIWKFPAGPGKVTIFYNPVHTFMRIGNRYFGTSGFARPGGGAGWFDVNKLPASYLATFREVHVPELGADSFGASSDTAGGGTITPIFSVKRQLSTSWASFKSSIKVWMSTLGPFPRD
jgi:hypothetical protein